MRVLPSASVLVALALLGCQREPAPRESAAADRQVATSTAATATPAPAAPAEQEHEGRGRITAVDAANGTVTLEHDAIATLGWPARSMAFDIAGEGMSGDLGPGDEVRFTLQQGRTGRLVITDIDATSASLATADTGDQVDASADAADDE